MTEMQRQFEGWCKRIGLEKAEQHPYFDDIKETAWQAWQASRAAIVVKLPDWDCYDTPRQALEACEDRLNDAGVIYE